MNASKKKNIPELRFSKYKAPWIQGKVFDFCPLQRGFDLPVSSIKKGDFPVVFSNGIMKTHNEFKVRAPGVVTGRSGTIGKVTYVEKDYWPHNTSLWVTDFRGNHPKFIYYFLTRLNLNKFSAGGGVPTLNRNDVHAFKTSVPNSINEQQKIASFLSSVDEKLNKHRHKSDLLETYKRGVMQKIFSQELRFKKKGGGDFPDWEERKLEELAERSTTKNNDESITRVLTNSATQGVIDQGEYFKKDIANAENLSGYYIVREGDYVYNPRISENAPVGPLNKNNIGDGVMSPLYSVFRFKDDENEFYEYYFKTTFWHRYMYGVANYGARHDRMNITTSDFMAMPLPCPHPDEQKKIVEFIRAVSQKADLVKSEIDQIEIFKQGLLQKMFV